MAREEGRFSPVARIRRFLQKEIKKEEVFGAIDRFLGLSLFRKKIFVLPVLVLIVGIVLLIALSHFYTWDTDSPSYYTAARGLASGINIYDQKEFQDLGTELFGKSVVVFPYIYWPLLAQLFIPLAQLDFPSYSFLLLVLNLVFSFLCLYLIYRILGLDQMKTRFPVIILFLLLVGNRPLDTTLHHGQVNIFVFFLVLLAILLLKDEKVYWSSLFMCLAVYLKIYPALFLVLFLFQKRYRYILFSAVNFLGLCGLSILIFSPRPWVQFLQMGIKNFLYGGKSEFFFDFNAQWGNNSLNGFFSQSFFRFGIPRNLVMPFVLLTVIAVILLFRKGLRRLISDTDIGFQTSVVLIVSLILSTISWNHHFVIMIFPIMYLFYRIMGDRRYGYLIPFVPLALLIIFHPWTGGFPFSLILFFSSVLFLGLLIHYHFSKTAAC